MPLPMIHFAVAIELAARSGRHPADSFLLGSIAPDSIHMRTGADRAAKRRTHLDDPPDTEEHTLLYEFLHPCLIKPQPIPAFTLGYVAHILADRLWRRTILASFRAQIPPDLDPAAVNRMYYQETDQIDFNLYAQADWRPDVWTRLARAPAPTGFDTYLTAAEIDQWRMRILRWFGELNTEPRITPRYITEPQVYGFIHQATDTIAQQFHLWQIEALHYLYSPESP